MKTVMILLLKGCVIGLAAGMPGLTAATAAFVLGHYQKIVQAIGSLNIQAFKYWHAKKWSELGQHVEWKPLLLLPLGFGAAFFALPMLWPALGFWQEQYKPVIYAAFCGTILGGLTCTLWSHRGGGFLGILLFFGGIAATLVLLMLPIRPLPGEVPFLFLHGLALIATQALPGFSAGFANRPLADLGVVTYYLDHGYWPALVLFGLGIVIGLVAIIFLLKLCYRKFSEAFLSLLMGLTAGSLMQIWPLRHLQQHNDQEMTFIAAAFAGGILFSLLLQFFQRRTLA
jgi:putative membrane protein